MDSEKPEVSVKRQTSQTEESKPTATPPYIGPEKQLTAEKHALLPEGETLTSEQALQRRSEEGDVHAFFTGENPDDRTLTEDEKDAFTRLVKDKFKSGEAKVIPFNFDHTPD